MPRTSQDNAALKLANLGLLRQVQVQIDNIAGLHPALATAHHALSLPPLRQIPGRLITKTDLFELSEVYPLRVCRLQNRLHCTGNIRLFQIAARILADNDRIHCIEEIALEDETLVKRWLKELLLGSSCLGAHFSDAPVLAALANRAQAIQQLPFESARFASVDYFMARLLGVDVRRFKNGHAKEDRLAPAANE